MALASLEHLTELAQMIRAACDSYAKNWGPTRWTWPGGSGVLPTYAVPVSAGFVVFGWGDDYPTRWWIGIKVLDDQPSENIVPDFEFNIPKIDSGARLAVQYELLDPRSIQARHTGRFTVRHGIKAVKFFTYYKSHPGSWPLLATHPDPRINLFTFDLDSFDEEEFQHMAEELGRFARYVIPYKSMIRAEQDGQRRK